MRKARERLAIATTSLYGGILARHGAIAAAVMIPRVLKDTSLVEIPCKLSEVAPIGFVLWQAIPEFVADWFLLGLLTHFGVSWGVLGKEFTTWRVILSCIVSALWIMIA